MIRTLPAWLFLAACSGGAPAPGDGPDAPVPEALPDPGTRTMHRLNRAELDNTFRDLFETALQPARDLPADESTHGYDNIAEGLTVSSVHLELLEAGVDEVLDELFGRDPETTRQARVQGEGPGTSFTGGMPYQDWAYALAEEGDAITASLAVDGDGLFRVDVRAFGRYADDAPAELRIEVDGVEADVLPLWGGLSEPEIVSTELQLDDGPHTFVLSLANPHHDALSGERRSATVDWLGVEGPLDPETGPSDAYPYVVSCDPVNMGEDACAAHVLTEFGRRAWRRPLTDADVAPFLGLYHQALDAGLAWDEGLQLGMKGLLLSPEFLYRIEADPPADGDPRPLDGHELAARLSFFLWSSTPDDALLAAAEDGSLLDPEVTAWQVRRMLEDPRAHALVDNLAGQWWDIRALDQLSPDATLYGNYDDELRASMQQELTWLAEDFLLDDRDLRDVLTTRETRLDPRLAAHYGLPAPAEDGARVSLDGTPRSGLITTAGWLAAQAHPDRPSAVRRGKWILENLLCAPPPPPPPEAEGLEPPDPILGSVREQEELRRGDPYCQSCHQRMDPMGFSLGHFDAIGGLRAVDELGFPIDASATMPDGHGVRSVVDMLPWLASDPRVPRCMAEQTATYALGRALRPTDDVFVDEVTTSFLEEGATFEALAIAIVDSPMFRMRGAPAADPEETP